MEASPKLQETWSMSTACLPSLPRSFSEEAERYSDIRSKTSGTFSNQAMFQNTDLLSTNSSISHHPSSKSVRLRKALHALPKAFDRVRRYVFSKPQHGAILSPDTSRTSTLFGAEFPTEEHWTRAQYAIMPQQNGNKLTHREATEEELPASSDDDQYQNDQLERLEESQRKLTYLHKILIQYRASAITATDLVARIFALYRLSSFSSLDLLDGVIMELILITRNEDKRDGLLHEWNVWQRDWLKPRPVAPLGSSRPDEPQFLIKRKPVPQHADRITPMLPVDPSDLAESDSMSGFVDISSQIGHMREVRRDIEDLKRKRALRELRIGGTLAKERSHLETQAQEQNRRQTYGPRSQRGTRFSGVERRASIQSNDSFPFARGGKGLKIPEYQYPSGFRDLVPSPTVSLVGGTPPRATENFPDFHEPEDSTAPPEMLEAWTPINGKRIIVPCAGPLNAATSATQVISDQPPKTPSPTSMPIEETSYVRLYRKYIRWRADQRIEDFDHFGRGTDRLLNVIETLQLLHSRPLEYGTHSEVSEELHYVIGRLLKLDELRNELGPTPPIRTEYLLDDFRGLLYDPEVSFEAMLDHHTAVWQGTAELPPGITWKDYLAVFSNTLQKLDEIKKKGENDSSSLSPHPVSDASSTLSETLSFHDHANESDVSLLEDGYPDEDFWGPEYLADVDASLKELRRAEKFKRNLKTIFNTQSETPEKHLSQSMVSDKMVKRRGRGSARHGKEPGPAEPRRLTKFSEINDSIEILRHRSTTRKTMESLKPEAINRIATEAATRESHANIWPQLQQFHRKYCSTPQEDTRMHAAAVSVEDSGKEVISEFYLGKELHRNYEPVQQSPTHHSIMNSNTTTEEQSFVYRNTDGVRIRRTEEPESQKYPASVRDSFEEQQRTSDGGQGPLRADLASLTDLDSRHILEIVDMFGNPDLSAVPVSPGLAQDMLQEGQRELERIRTYEQVANKYAATVEVDLEEEFQQKNPGSGLQKSPGTAPQPNPIPDNLAKLQAAIQKSSEFEEGLLTALDEMLAHQDARNAAVTRTTVADEDWFFEELPHSPYFRPTLREEFYRHMYPDPERRRSFLRGIVKIPRDFDGDLGYIEDILTFARGKR